MGSKTRRYILVLLLLFLLMNLLALLNVALGSVSIPLGELRQILFHNSGTLTNASIVWKIRLPRTIACLLLGGALALSGFLLQTFFNNPIAGPYVLGISSGAKLVVALVMVFWLGTYHAVSSVLLIAAAFVGAMVSMGFVLLVARKVSQAAVLIVSGVMIGYICSAITESSSPLPTTPASSTSTTGPGAPSPASPGATSA